MKYKGTKTAQISFPLGGIGAGCIGLAGNGSLVDWEIFNRPNKGWRNGLSHFAVRAEKNGKVLDYRLLNGDLPVPYTGVCVPMQKGACIGYGFGPEEMTMSSWTHFREHEFTGEFPFAHLDFGGEDFPATTALTAWSVLIPGNSKDSSLPAAFFEIELKNNTDEPIDYTTVGVLQNPWSKTCMEHSNRVEGQKLICHSGLPEDNFDYGDLTLSLQGEQNAFSFQQYFYRGLWRDHQETYYTDIMRGGLFSDRVYTGGKCEFGDLGLLASHFTLKPGESKTVVFTITWNIPNCTNYWSSPEDLAEIMKKNGVAENRWKNYYATVWKDSSNSAAYAEEHYARLHAGTKQFHDELFASTLPESVLDGISSNISILKSPTCLRLEDGTFYGWEGVAPNCGSCEGSCSHVWNYAQALPFLFPDLERSMRESHLNYSIDEAGGSHFRVSVPLGIHADTKSFRPCADGQFGDVMKIYRDWKISGCDDYIRKWWSTIKRTIEYAWSDKNPDRWDPEQSGVVTGRQHHTLDMELFGPNSWLTGHYLGAFLAAEKMALFMNDYEFAEKCRTLFAKGKKWMEGNLFNGEFYAQKIDLKNPDVLKSFGAMDVYWHPDSGEVKYQIANGCCIDATLAQWYASLYGLGEIFDPERNKKTLRSIYKYNFKRSMRDIINRWRTFCLNDESGVMMCTWPKDRPAIPLTYNTETMHGFEWSLAGNMVMAGMIQEAVEITDAIRYRYNGERRNPWNEIECGNNYARSMASYGLLPAFSGFRYDRSRGMLGFSPKINLESFRSFWCLGELWGSIAFEKDHAELTVSSGSMELKELLFDRLAKEIWLNGTPVGGCYLIKAGDQLSVRF